uniref:Guanylate cyclase n=1 Tax=Elaeophora elaphi TaxID=1147741 RepID=A0A0R3RQB3_9BILA
MDSKKTIGDKCPFGRKIQCPQLMVMDINDESFYIKCRKKMRKAEAKMIFNVSVMSSFPFDKNIFAASLIHNFPRRGGTAVYGDVVLEYTPKRVPPDAMRIRLYIAFPSDRKEWYNQVCLQRAGLIGLLIQTFIAIELSNFNNEVPMESRTMTSGTYVAMSEPQFTEMTPSVALLQLDKTATELAHERHLAKYIRERLSLLGQVDTNKLLHLVFLLSPRKSDGTVEKDKIETMLDLSVIKSAGFHFMPAVASQVHRFLRNVSHGNFLLTHRYWRVMDWENGAYTLMHTKGGIIAQYLGAVMHEVGHLFKIPHMNSGIMCRGGENIQTFFLPLKKVNLGFTAEELPQLPKIHENIHVCKIKFRHEIMVRQIMESLLDSTSKLLMTVHPLITHKPRKKMCPIYYDEETGMVRVKSGVLYLMYYTNDETKRMFSFTEQYLKKRLVLRTTGPPVRALIVTGEGNFFTVLVTNTCEPSDVHS